MQEVRDPTQDPERAAEIIHDHMPELSRQEMEKDKMSDNVRDINLQIRLNGRELEMLEILCAAYGLKRTDVIRKLIREDWETLQPLKEW